MATIQKLSGVTGAGPIVYRKKGYGAGTLGGFDFKNTYCQPLGVATVPTATSLLNLVRGGAVATTSGANAGTAGGGLTIGTGKKILLPSTFKIASDATDVLIVIWLKHGTQTLASGSATPFGCMTDSAANANWGAYSVFGAMGNYNFVGAGTSLATLTGFVAGTIYQLAIRMQIVGTTLTYTLYKNGVVAATASKTVVGTFPQPACTPVIGAQTAGSITGEWVGEAYAIDITNMTLETRTADDIVLADYNLYSTRFS